MNNIVHLPRQDIHKVLQSTFDWVLFSISYEPRTTAVWFELKNTQTQFLAFHNSDHEYLLPHLNFVKENLPGCKIEELKSNSPLQRFDRIVRAIGALNAEKPARIGLDITCFTRETLAIIILVLKHVLPAGSIIKCLYTAAGAYPTQTETTEARNWLSKGVADVRSILGYKGNIKLISKTHLIILPGFEIERANSIIESIEPDKLTIGTAEAKESILPQFSEIVDAIKYRIQSHYPDHNIHGMRFSSINPYTTCQNLLAITQPDENTVVACLNNKIAMTGACMAALKSTDIQLIYAQPMRYNTLSSPSIGSELIVFDLIF